MTDDLNFAIPTANKMGYSTQILDEDYSQAFINYLKQLSKPNVLEIGTGYGTAASLA